ncbi:MAG: hypothetical protein KAI64_02755 [Thermoplasmata archaeon]|nr:hypothetical protein [Thermoplasmata archaeon]
MMTCAYCNEEIEDIDGVVRYRGKSFCSQICIEYFQKDLEDIETDIEFDDEEEFLRNLDEYH